MMSLFLLLFLSHPAMGVDQSDIVNNQTSFIGMKYVNLPPGFKHLIGTMLEDKPYGVTVVEKGGKKIAWLGRIVGYKENGKPEWEVLDALIFPQLKKGQELADICNNEIRGRKYTITIATFNRDTPDRKTIKIHHAWQVNLKLKKFESIPTQGIECIDPGGE
jgi:hypothetical protein